jgi:hypothetical protein
LNVDGVLGLAPTPPEDIIGGKTFIDSLYDASIISTKQIGLFFGDTKYQSHAYFGGFDP